MFIKCFWWYVYTLVEMCIVVLCVCRMNGWHLYIICIYVNLLVDLWWRLQLNAVVKPVDVFKCSCVQVTEMFLYSCIYFEEEQPQFNCLDLWGMCEVVDVTSWAGVHWFCLHVNVNVHVHGFSLVQIAC